MIIDNCLPEAFFKDFLMEVCRWDTVGWFFSEHTAHNFTDNDTLFDSSWAHTSVALGNDNSHLAPISREAVNYIMSATGEKLHFLSRVRFGLITASPNRIVHGAHVDYIDFKHKTGLLYLNDSDGDTIFYNKFHKENSQYPIKCTMEDVETTVSPKANRVCTFDGWQYHSSSTPVKNSYRLVMNFNYVTK